jgi:hypothetical protein
MIWALVLGAVAVLIGTAIFVFRVQFRAGQRSYLKSLGFPESSTLEPRSDLGYALARSVPLWIGGVVFIMLALLTAN